jgi:hypothetical protein
MKEAANEIILAEKIHITEIEETIEAESVIETPVQQEVVKKIENNGNFFFKYLFTKVESPQYFLFLSFFKRKTNVLKFSN